MLNTKESFISQHSNSAIIQCENRIKKYFKNPIFTNRQYCKLHNIDYLFYEFGYDDLPPYWWKVRLVAEALHKYTYVAWLDTDAIVYNMHCSLEQMFTKENIHKLMDLYINGSNQSLYNKLINKSVKPIGNLDNKCMIFSSGPLNKYKSFIPVVFDFFQAGVFIVKSCSESIELFKDWLALYNPDKWNLYRDENNKYKFKYIGGGLYSGLDYEQGAFTLLIEKYNDNLVHVPVYILTDEMTVRPHELCWSFHLSIKTHLKRYPYFIN